MEKSIVGCFDSGNLQAHRLRTVSLHSAGAVARLACPASSNACRCTSDHRI